MRTALVLVAVLLARTAQAQPTSPSPPQPTAPAAPQVPLPATPVDPSTPPPPAPAPTSPDAAPTPQADPAYGESKDPSLEPAEGRAHTVVIRYIPERSRNNVIMLAALGGAAVLFGAGGLYFHLESRSSTDKVQADSYTGTAWTPERQAAYDDAHSQATIAEVLYGIGGGLALATAVAYIVTEPTMTEAAVTPRVTPTHGGAMIGGGWSF